MLMSKEMHEEGSGSVYFCTRRTVPQIAGAETQLDIVEHTRRQMQVDLGAAIMDKCEDGRPYVLRLA